MKILLIIIVVIAVLVVYSKNKEKERQENQRRKDAENITTNYKEGYNSWLNRKQRYYSPYSPSNDEVLAHKDEIIKLHEEILDGYRVAAERDDKFAREQNSFNGKCYALSKELLPNEGRYHDIEWYKNKSTGGSSKEKLRVWQFFVNSLCLNQELDYSCSTYYKQNYENLPKIKDKNRYWDQRVYDRINKYISTTAESLSRPLIIALVDTKNGWDKDSLEYHLKNIKRDIPNTIVSPFSQLSTNITDIGKHLEHLIVIDVFTENSQLIDICVDIDRQFSPAHSVIAYISLLKCYDTEEMKPILLAKSIKQNYPYGYLDWSMEFEGKIQDQIIIESEETIKQRQQKYEQEIESEYRRIREKYPLGTEYYEKNYSSSASKTIHEKIVEHEDVVAKYNKIYAKYIELQKKYPLGLQAFEKHNSYDNGKNNSGYNIEKIVECEDEICQFEQKEKNRINQQRVCLTTKVQNWSSLQNGLHYSYLLRYYPINPITCELEATEEEWTDRYRVWNFKNDPNKVSENDHDKAMKWVLHKVKDKLIETFGEESLKHLTLVCITASSKMRTERRYKDFSSMLCEETGMENSYSYINITKDAEPKCLHGTGKPTVEFDTNFFKNKNVIIFDDVITSGRSMIRMKEKLENLGAFVVCCISIGKTFHNRP